MRRKKNMTIEERIELNRSLIVEKKNEIKELEKELKALEQMKEEEELRAIHKMIVDSGKSITEIKEMLKTGN